MNKYGNIIKKTVLCLFVCFLILIEFPPSVAVYAENLKFYNYTTKSNVNYTGTQVIYKLNERELPLTYPGIIISGIALADYEELFVRELGLDGHINGNVITISDGTTVLELTLGSKQAIVNGKKTSISVAPIKLGFGDTVKYYVPTNFVSETFGFRYIWVSKDSTAKITKVLPLSVNGQEVDYNKAFYSIGYENQSIPLELPILYYNGFIMAPAETVFKAAGCLYEKTEQTICITKGDITLTFELNSKTAYANGKKIIVGAEPLHIINRNTNAEYDYVSLEFAAELLGFELSLNEKDFLYNLSESELTGNAELHPLVPTPTAVPTVTPESESEVDIEVNPVQKFIFEDQEPLSYYFDWSAPEEAETNAEQRYINKVTAYSLEQADVVELYGVTRADINDFMDNGLLVIELKNILTTIETQYYADYSSSRLLYAILTGLYDNTKLFFMPHADAEWYFVEKENKVQLYFVSKEINEEDLFITVIPTPTPSPIPTPLPTPAPEVKALYPEDVFILPVPETVTNSQIQNQDDYLKRQFQISITGNHTEFYQNIEAINPYYLVEDYFVSYDGKQNVTTITFATKIICGYQYSLENGYLAITIGRPSEIYSKIVVLDAGHGGKDPGATKNGYKEKDISFTILNNYTKKLFENSDIKVYFTRETDVLIDLYDRADFTSEVGADLFLSLHLNANNSTAVKGTEVYYSADNNKTTTSGLNSYLFAKHMVDNLSKTMSTKNRGALKSEFVVVKYNTVPAVLVELGYMTNTEDLAKLTNKTYQQKAAETIYRSVLEIFEQYPASR